MPEPNGDRDMEQLLSRLGDEFAASGSIASSVEARLRDVSMRPPRGRLAPIAIAAALLVIAGFWLGREWSARHGAGRDIADAGLRVQTRCAVGDAVLIEHLASLVGQRGVLVVWSCRGADLAATGLGDALSSNAQPTAYDEYVLAREPAGDGRIVVWSLFVAPEDVQPALDPPAIRVATADGRVIVLKTSPGVRSRKELTDVLRSARLPGKQRASLEDIEWVVGGT